MVLRNTVNQLPLQGSLSQRSGRNHFVESPPLCQVLNPTISRRKVQVDDHWNLRLLKMNNRTSLLTTTGPDQDISFRTSHFVDISGQLETKLAALESYAEEMRDFPHPRCRCEALARLRGSQVGLKAAEVFIVLRQISPR